MIVECGSKLDALEREAVLKANAEEPEASDESVNEKVDAALEELAPLIEDLQNAVSRGDFEQKGISDTIWVEAEVTSNRDIENAYAAIVVSFQKDSAYARMNGEEGTFASVVRVGDIMGGSPRKLRLVTRMEAGSYEDAECDLYLYSGDGHEIATTLSRGVKMLTNSQLKKLEGNGG